MAKNVKKRCRNPLCETSFPEHKEDFCDRECSLMYYIFKEAGKALIEVGPEFFVRIIAASIKESMRA